MKFELYSDFDPSTDQQKVIDKLSKGVSDKQASQLLLNGFFAMANIIKNMVPP